MSVILVTGAPGSGKTAHTLDLIAHDSQFKGRPLFQMGIPDLLIDHQSVPPVAEWVEMRESPEDASISLPYFVFPPNSVIVIDEAQRVFRPRPVGSKVPPEVQAFETHRHTGVDFVLITQHPNLIDSNVRKLIGRHFHVHITSMGRYLLDWPRLGDVESKSDRELATRQRYKPPKRVFGLYKSAEAHTVIKRKLPWYFWLFVMGLILTFAGVYYVYNRISAKVEGKPQAPEASLLSAGNSSGSGGKSSEKLSKAEYFAEMVPRVPTLHHTAPRYDEVTKPVDAPWPVGCFVRAKHEKRAEECRCVDQQGNKYVTSDSQCRQIVANGIFKDWGEKREEPRQEAKRPYQDRQQALPQVPQQAPQAVPPAPLPPAQVAESNPRPIPSDSPWRFRG